jgi:uncharacterized YigZ family protein
MQTIKVNQDFTLTIKKSKFLAFAFKVNSEAEANLFLANLKKEHGKARHIVYAYRILEAGQIKERVHNDGEPSKSAGWPIYNLLKMQDIVGCLLVVVRYYGGIKLGVGGLVRAYTESAQAVIKYNLNNV